MSTVRRSVSSIAWAFVLVSSLLFALSLSLLASVALDAGWRVTRFEAASITLAVLSLAGLFSGVGLLKRYGPARYFALFLLGLAAVYWSISVGNLLLSLFGATTMFLAELRDYPAAGEATCAISFFGLWWCVGCIKKLRRPEVKREFGA